MPHPEPPMTAYLSGFGNEHSTEALAGALPIGQFSPQRCPYGLYAEKFSSSAFTAPRASNARSWFYRIRPSVVHGVFRRQPDKFLMTAPLIDVATPPDQLRWNPMPIPDRPTDFIDGLFTVAANGDVKSQTGIAIHLYAANKSMTDRFFYDTDGELLIVPQQGRLAVHTECVLLQAGPGQIVVIPRGLKFRVELDEAAARGYICENYGARLSLPERGPVGSDGFANDRDFLAPVAAFDDREGQFELLVKFQGRLYACDMTHSPLDVVAWTGNSYPYQYDLARFNTIGSVSYDHPDPSIYTVLSSASDTAGVANVDFAIFPDRWMVAENTFRPPWFHRNIMSEYMGLIRGTYDAKEEGFLPGGGSLHNCMAPHGPDTEAHAKATASSLQPERYQNTLAFMFESRYVIEPTRHAMESEHLQHGYRDCWQGLRSHFTGAND